MKSITILVAGSFLILGFSIYKLVTHKNQDSTDIRIVDTGSTFSFDAVYPNAHTQSVVAYIDSSFTPVDPGFENGALDKDIVFPDKSHFEIRSEQGRLLVFVRKDEVSDSLLSKIRVVFGKQFGSALH